MSRQYNYSQNPQVRGSTAVTQRNPRNRAQFQQQQSFSRGNPHVYQAPSRVEMSGFVGIIEAGPPAQIQPVNVNNNNVEHHPNPRTNERDFSRIMECPVCYTTPDNEIFLCETGHGVCGNCRRRMVKCAFCAKPYTGARNFALEELVSHFKKFQIPMDGLSSHRELPASNGKMLCSCRHQAEGCTAMMEYSELANHENERCDYRPVRCKVTTETKCKWDTYVNLSVYLRHLINYHNVTGLSEASGYFTKIDRLFMGLEINTNWPPFYMNFDGKTFLRFASLRNRMASWWVQLIGPDSEALKYRAVISLHSPAKPENKISWSVPVYSIRCNKTVIDEQNTATISSTAIVPYCALDEPFENRVATHTWFCNISLSRTH